MSGKQLFLKNALLFTALSCYFFGNASAQTLRINEIMASNAETIIDEDGDTPDWIEIYNPGASSVSLLDFGLSDNLDNPRKWLFPSAQIQPGEHLLIFASGKDRKATSNWTTVIDHGDHWRYLVGTFEPPSTWKNLSFNANSWKQGPSGFGYGDNDDATFLSSLRSLYIRKKFTLTETNRLQALRLYVDVDDGFVAYLNGIEIARFNLGAPGEFFPYSREAPTFVEPRMVNGEPPLLFTIDNFAGLVKEGENVLAIQTHNVSLTSSDFTMIPFLIAAYDGAPPNPVRGIPKVLEGSLPRLHTNFRLSASGETTYLSNAAGALVDSLAAPLLFPDYTFGRKPDGSANLTYFQEPTPGVSNNNARTINRFSDPVIFSHTPGFYSSTISLELDHPNSQANIYYTRDGSAPDASDRRYTSPISISKTTVVRAVAIVPGETPIFPSTATFFIKENISLPVVSVIAEPADFWDNDTGIYVDGDNAQDAFPHFGANFWEDWERPGVVDFFEPDGAHAFQAGVGVKIFGGWSRGYPQKSLSIFARAQYGTSNIDYALFGDRGPQRFEAFVLRNSGNDWFASMMRDGLMQSLVDDFNVDRLQWRPAIVFINGEYWGIHHIREKINEHYVASHHDVAPNEVDLLEIQNDVIHGRNDDYLALLNYIQNNNLANDDRYAWVEERIDVDSYLDYMVAQIFFDNRDWPGNNIKYWKARRPEAKWRWILFDTDFGFGLFEDNTYGRNTIAFALDPNGPGWPNPPWSTYLFRNLVKNEGFENALIHRFADRLNTDFTASRIEAVTDSILSIITPEIQRHRGRWSGSAWNWSGHIARIRQFGELRPSHQRSHVLQQFGLSGTFRLTVDASPSEGGGVRVGVLDLKNLPWSGDYFRNVPVEIKAEPNLGYRFLEWSDQSFGANPEITLETSQNYQISAIFEKAPASEIKLIINEINYRSAPNADAGDWVELYNPSSDSVALFGWRFQDGDDLHQFIFPANLTIAGKGFMVLAQDLQKFQSVFPAVENVVGNFNFGLSGGGELVRLRDPSGEISDSLSYDDAAPWPTAADGQGRTLELIAPESDNSQAQNWQASFVPGGTPGAPNSLPTSAADDEGNAPPNAFSLEQNYPNPFNPVTLIRFQLPEKSDVSLKIYNSAGQLVRTLATGKFFAGTHEIIWDARDDFGNQAASGVYLYTMEAGAFSAKRKMIFLK